MGSIVELNFKGQYTSTLPKSGTVCQVPEVYAPPSDIQVPAIFEDANGNKYLGDVAIYASGVVSYGYSSTAARWIMFQVTYLI